MSVTISAGVRAVHHLPFCDPFSIEHRKRSGHRSEGNEFPDPPLRTRFSCQNAISTCILLIAWFRAEVSRWSRSQRGTFRDCGHGNP